MIWRQIDDGEGCASYALSEPIEGHGAAHYELTGYGCGNGYVDGSGGSNQWTSFVPAGSGRGDGT